LHRISKADLLSLLNSAFGLLSIIFSLKGDFWNSGSMIFLASLSDGIDGLIARKYGSSEIGKFLDSLADLVSFCIAPLVLVLSLHKPALLLLPFLLFFLFTSILRLASYPLKKSTDFFVGLPVPAASLVVALLALLKLHPIYPISSMIILSSLMISDLRFPKIKGKYAVIAFILIISTAILRSDFHSIAPILLLLSLLIYIIFGPFYCKAFKQKVS